ncbi:MAG TPA: RsmD family RNA methyltransferase [Candidatus Azoamicus sp.]
MNIKIKIKSGLLKKKYILIENLYNIKPTKDIVKKTIISYIKNFKNINTLDLFSGTGKICFELFSIGSKKLILIEHKNDIVKTIKENIKNLIHIKDFFVYHNDSYIWLTNINFLNISFVIFDPPYNFKKYEEYFFLINKIKILKKFLILIIEVNKKDVIETLPLNFFIIKKKKIGQTIIYITKKI